MTKHSVVDIRRFPEPGESIEGLSRPALRLASYFGRVVSAATSSPRPGEFLSGLRCRRRPQRQACPGKLKMQRLDIPADILWGCNTCPDGGVIRNWRGSYWDFTRFRREAGCLPVLKTFISNDEFGHIWTLPHLEREAQYLLFGARTEGDQMHLEGPADYFQLLLGSVALEANHSPDPGQRALHERVAENLNQTLGLG